MPDLSQDLQNVWAALAHASNSAGKVIMFIGARSGDGTSMIARSFAKLCTKRSSKAVWLLDLDFFNDNQMAAIGAQDKWHGPFDMCFGAEPFWRATPHTSDNNQGFDALVGYRFGNSNLFVSKFRAESLSAGQSIQIGPAPLYWEKLRQSIDVTIIDAPALERSRAGLALVAAVDGVVLLVDGETGDPRDSLNLRDEILNRGGKCLGVVVVNGKQRAQGHYGKVQNNDEFSQVQ